ncbi:MAG: SatD family protein [Cryomorphaceae bacterium]|nr:SatD family protein [Flavobacteriales bacterium]
MVDRIAVLTGDIVNSRKGNSALITQKLRELLGKHGEHPYDWEIYRGDSFQLKAAVSDALLIAFRIKSGIKTLGRFDVRIAIGIGNEDFCAERVTESNGSAYVNSGTCFDFIQKQLLAIKSDDPEKDRMVNTMVELALLTADNWTVSGSKVLEATMDHPELSQSEIAATLNKSQSSISEALNRAGYDEILKMIEQYKSIYSGK